MAGIWVHKDLVDLSVYEACCTHSMILISWKIFEIQVLDKLKIGLSEEDLENLGLGTTAAIDQLLYCIIKMAQNLATRKPSVPGKPKTPKISDFSKTVAESTAAKDKLAQSQSLQRPLVLRKPTPETVQRKSRPQDFQDPMQSIRLTRLKRSGHWCYQDLDVATYQSSGLPTPLRAPRSATPVPKPQIVSPKRSKESKEPPVLAQPRSKSPHRERNNKTKSFFDKYLKFAYDLSTPEGVRQLEAHFFPDQLAEEPSTSKAVAPVATPPGNIVVTKQLNATKADPRPGREEPTKRDHAIETILEKSKFY
ncbi:GL18510 [Drosophila persimilis]|uniref:GL18510 n=1 Tax=Drosophila persimilis TaxID=7234 RepID=B4G7C5_DROPE|nr:GL18510 [Drosophila persimilis]